MVDIVYMSFSNAFDKHAFERVLVGADKSSRNSLIPHSVQDQGKEGKYSVCFHICLLFTYSAICRDS